MNREHRTFRNVEVRAEEQTGPNGRPVVSLRAITPGVVDDYGSVWMPDTFDARIKARMTANPDDTPTLCWSHDWSDPIGHGITYDPSSEGPRIGFELDDFEAVPRARQADAQVRSKTIRDCSVGFSHTKRREPTPEEQVRWPGCVEVIEEADLDEVSLVLRGAVPGAKVLAIRSAGGQRREVPEALVIDLAKQVADGTLTKEAAQVAIDLAAGSGVGTAGGSTEGGSPPLPPGEAATLDDLDDQDLDLLEQTLGIG